ncbi:MAG: HK97 gp10 family phage protein [Muricomes sp.]
MADIKIEGLEKLQKALKKNVTLSDVKRVVKQNGSELQSKAKRKAPVDTGDLKRSIGLEISSGGMTAKVEPTVEYAAYLEYGTRFQKAQPYLKPSLEEQEKQFKSDMQKLVK